MEQASVVQIFGKRGRQECTEEEMIQQDTIINTTGEGGEKIQNIF